MLEKSLENKVSLCLLYLGLGGQCMSQVKDKSFGILTLLCLGLGCRQEQGYSDQQGREMPTTDGGSGLERKMCA